MRADAYMIGKVNRKTVENEKKVREMQRCAERIWNALSEYVKFDKDGIFKDPYWPRMWDKR